jgi:hypothetical protein
MPMPRDYTLIVRDLIDEEVLCSKEVLFNILNWLSEDEVYRFCVDEYDEITSIAYKEKYDILDESIVIEEQE